MERGIGWELSARSGRAVLTGRDSGDEGADPATLDLPDGLGAALNEWAGVSERLALAGADEPTELVTRRGRQLAARLARATGRPVEYVDPLSWEVELIAPEPTPWATGLTVTGVSATVVVVALLALTEGLAEIGAWVPPVALLVVTAGVAPSLWLGRRTPIWRWMAYGVGAGVMLAWPAYLLSVLL